MKNIKRACVFYCNPSCSYQKSAIEINQELIRRIVPKGKNFDSCNQEAVFMMMICNSNKRKN